MDDVIDEFDLASAVRPNREQKRVKVGFPVWMVESLDREASRLGVTRQAIIEVWIAERLEKVGSSPEVPGGDDTRRRLAAPPRLSPAAPAPTRTRHRPAEARA